MCSGNGVTEAWRQGTTSNPPSPPPILDCKENRVHNVEQGEQKELNF